MPPVRAPRSAAAGGLAALLREHDRDRYLTALFAPAERREALFALYAFNFEIARVRELVSEPPLGRIRLQWWRESIAAIYEGGPVRRHEVVEPLAAAIRRFDLSHGEFERLVDARDGDLDGAPPADLVVLEAYAAESAGCLVALALEALGIRDPVTMRVGRAVGTGFALAGILRGLPFHLPAGRNYLPTSLVEEAGLALRDATARRSSPALAEVARRIAETAASHLAEARARRREVPRAALPALLPARLASRYLGCLARAGFDPFAPVLRRTDGLAVWRLAAAALVTGRY